MSLKAYFECFPCLLRQAIEAVNFLQVDDELKREILNDSMRIMIDIDPDLTSAEIAASIHRNIIQKVGGKDPYEKVKRESLKTAFEYYNDAKNLIASSSQPLETALKLCAAGNIIDFGPASEFELKRTMERALQEPFARFAFKEFMTALQKANSILFLADNAGETVFDRLLIEEIKRPLTYVVKKDAIMNDAIVIDAELTNFPEYVTIVDNGSAIQGTVLSQCSRDFVDRFEAADMIIAKGMANFETLPEEGKRTFFLLKIKCVPIAKLSGIPNGSFVVKQGGLFT